MPFRERPGFLRRIALLGDHGGGPKRGGRAKDRADIAWVRHLIQHQYRAGPFQSVGQARYGQRIGEQRRALVRRIPAQKLIQPVPLGALRLDRPRWCEPARRGLPRPPRSAAAVAAGAPDWRAPPRRRAGHRARSCRGGSRAGSPDADRVGGGGHDRAPGTASSRKAFGSGAPDPETDLRSAGAALLPDAAPVRIPFGKGRVAAFPNPCPDSDVSGRRGGRNKGASWAKSMALLAYPAQIPGLDLVADRVDKHTGSAIVRGSARPEGCPSG